MFDLGKPLCADVFKRRRTHHTKADEKYVRLQTDMAAGYPLQQDRKHAACRTRGIQRNNLRSTTTYVDWQKFTNKYFVHF